MLQVSALRPSPRLGETSQLKAPHLGVGMNDRNLIKKGCLFGHPFLI